MYCEICKRFCKDFRSLGVHIRSAHHMSTEDYYVRYIGSRQNCVTCGKSTKFINLSHGFAEHCSNKCAQLDPVVAKAREDGCFKHFGYTNALKNPDICNRAITTRVENIKNLANDNNLIAIPQTDSYMLSRICVTANIKIIKIGQKCFVHNDDYNKLLLLYESWKNGQSLFELQIIDIIKSMYDGPISYNNKEIIGPKELDIYLPELNLAFEVNGNYRHSKEFKDKYYHINKTNLCKSKNIRLVHIFEYEWLNSRNDIKQMIFNAINNVTKTNKKLILDLSKESVLAYPNYVVLEILEPILINNIYNCGYAIIEEK